MGIEMAKRDERRLPRRAETLKVRRASVGVSMDALDAANDRDRAALHRAEAKEARKRSGKKGGESAERKRLL